MRLIASTDQENVDDFEMGKHRRALKVINQALRTGYGWFIRISGIKMWLDIHFGDWARHRNTPLWLTLDFARSTKTGRRIRRYV